jgi:hypothetical protein
MRQTNTRAINTPKSIETAASCESRTRPLGSNGTMDAV